MRKYWVMWTYLGNYSGVREVEASSPKNAIEQMCGFYEDNPKWKEYSHIYVWMQPPSFEMKPGR